MRRYDRLIETAGFIADALGPQKRNALGAAIPIELTYTTEQRWTLKCYLDRGGRAVEVLGSGATPDDALQGLVQELVSRASATATAATSRKRSRAA